LLNSLIKQKQSHALLLTTTSTILMNDLIQGLDDTTSLAGLHILPNLPNWDIIEVVQQPMLDPHFITQTAAFITGLGCLPIVVTPTPGYLLLRVLMPYLFEAMHLVDEKIPILEIDRAARFFG